MSWTENLILSHKQILIDYTTNLWSYGFDLFGFSCVAFAF